ncbi:Cytochrome c oxidase subunit 6 [Hanseniaspora opuntiae]|uniref:Cytochrome c oxidase subunit 6, mitochondrial n=1 Tax=Hanseniaspora opuntiae TaxID=211096 RepID=A0A1E5RAM0_9ASCO|nr:Cytochrome c oxidase subunit 6, mitochondrial [Hanseniaspora opuntiae]
MFSRAFRIPTARLAIKPIAPVFNKAALQTVFIKPIRMYSSHDEESFEEFTARYEKEFDEAYDVFEVQRVLNNCFSYDLVPAPAVIERALLAARRVNDLPTAMRVFEALKYKVETPDQYEAYLVELEDLRKELGIPLKEELFSKEE